MIDYYACIKHKYPGIDDSAFELIDTDGVVTLKKWDSSYGSLPTMMELDAVHLDVVRQKALAEVKELRRLGLDKAAISSGILAVYNSNYEAAVAYLAGNNIAIKNGMLASEYLEGFGARLQMTAEQFANYIVAENIRIGPTVYDIEKRYLALTYAGDVTNGIYPISMLTDEYTIINAVESFRIYCQL